MKDLLTNSELGDEWVRPSNVAPFSDAVIAFLDAVSRGLRQSNVSPQAANVRAGVAALAFWLRKASQSRSIIREFSGVPVACGTVFHVAPGNVEAMFAYSWAAGVVTGNANIVRLPSERGQTTEFILKAIRDALETPAGEAFRGTSVFVNYPSDAMEITAEISRKADVRVIWGGDQTVARIRSISAKPNGRDIAFVDKISLTILDAVGVAELDDKRLKTLTDAFVVDAWTYDQMACSSPRLVVWLGAATGLRDRFWHSVEASLDGHPREPAMIAMNRLVDGFQAAAEGAGVPSMGPRFTRVAVERLDAVVDGPGGGYFHEIEIESLKELRGKLSSHHQTAAHAGFTDTATLRAAVESGALRVDRVVPVGQALSFDYVWDGFDMLSQLVRVITVR